MFNEEGKTCQAKRSRKKWPNLFRKHFWKVVNETNEFKWINLILLKIKPINFIFLIYVVTQIFAPKIISNPVSRGCCIHRLHPCRGLRPHPMSVLEMILNNLMVRLQWCQSFGKWGVLFHCHHSQIHSDWEW